MQMMRATRLCGCNEAAPPKLCLLHAASAAAHAASVARHGGVRPAAASNNQ